MKKINESRITTLTNYIKDYCASRGIAPTYREIMEELHYSSLSLVSSDIKRLKERGILIDDDFSHIRLVSNKDEHIHKYDYPFIIMTDAGNNIEYLCDDEKKLLEAQDEYLKGNYQEAQRISKSLLETSKDLSIHFGARFTLCWSSLYTGEVNNWTTFFKLMISYQPKSISEKMEKEMMAHFLTSTLGSKDNCPDWLTNGRFYDLRKEAYPLANLLFMGKVINSNPPVSPHLLEPTCSITRLYHIDIAQVYMDLYLAISYHYSGNDEFLYEHLNGAIQTCLRHNWITPLAEVRKSLGSVMYPLLEDNYEEGITKKIDAAVEQLVFGYTKLRNAFVGENPLKDLTFREVEVINYVHLDYSTKEIADKLYLSPETVKYYLSSIYLKLGVSGRKELRNLVKTYSK